MKSEFILKILNNKWLTKTPFVLSLFAFVCVILEVGFHIDKNVQITISVILGLTLFIGFLMLGLRLYVFRDQLSNKVYITDSVFLFFLAIMLLKFVGLFSDEGILGSQSWIYLGVLVIFIREFAAMKITFYRNKINPAQLFLLSFVVIIFIGSFALMMPKATNPINNESISFVNALFTSTSAVCVTGLAVVDTGSYFTPLGHVILLLLIQIGGLGIMTFASYFAYFFRGGTSFENHLMVNELNNSDKLSEVFGTLKKVIFITLIFEFIGAVCMFLTLNTALIPKISDRLFFSIFHSISSFCNAGFSTLPENLYQEGYKYNYSLHLIVAFLIILGGIGFPIILNIYQYIKYNLVNRIFKIWKNEKRIYLPWLVNLNSRIVIYTTIILTVVGSVFFFVFEYNNTLQSHGMYGKIVTSFFGSVTPRTAGYNTVNMLDLTVPTILITIILMWIGASPGSTGGGIKTSTFAVATLNFFSLAKGKTRIELYRREVSDLTVRKALAIISLSLIIIGNGVFIIAYLEPGKNILAIVFECFSAFSTVGLSLNFTPLLGDGSKVTLICIMFIGRVSMLSILIAFIRKEKYKNYRYPTEEVVLN